MKLKKGDTVVVITGKDKGKQGEVQRVLPDRQQGDRHRRQHAPPSTPRPRRANDKAGIIDRDMPIHVSNVMLVHKGKPIRVGYEMRDGKKVRVAKSAAARPR